MSRCGTLSQRVHKRAGRVQKMLAVVQDQQHGAIAQRVDHFVLRAPVSGKSQAQRLSYCRGQSCRVCHWCQLHYPDTVRELTAQRMRRGLSQPGLADSGGADNADQVVRAYR